MGAEIAAMRRYFLYGTVAAAILGGGVTVWSLAAYAQGAPTPFSIFWNATGTPPYVPVSTSNPLPVTPVSGGTDQNVNIDKVANNAVLTGAGATGNGSMRTTTAQDTTTIAGAAPGTAGTPSANVVSVQGEPNMTPVQTTTAPSSLAAAGIAPVVSASAEGTHVLKGTPGNLYDLYVTTGTTPGYVMTFNATSAPGDGAVTPIDCIQAPASQTTALFTLASPPEVFSTGISVAFSTTGCFTKTVSATAFFHGRVQ
jgi:hypothetical protein